MASNTYIVTKRFTFEAHHRLPWHQGKCARDHGHSYILEVSVAGTIKPNNGDSDAGMVLDFQNVSDAVKPTIENVLDHHSLNDVLQNPTAERLVEWLAVGLKEALPGLCRLRLYETENSWVEWFA